MNSDTLSGEGQNLTGKLKEVAGSATGDETLRTEGVADQLSGNAQQIVGAARDAVANGVGPLVDQAKTFARNRPFAAAALAGVVGIALLNTLRGKK